MKFDVTLDLRDVERGLGTIRARAISRAGAFFKTLAKPARADVRDHQKERKGEASAWPPRAASTIARARRGGRRRRRKGPRAGLLGSLPRTWKTLTDRGGLTLRHRVPWSGIHDRGGTAGNGARIPKRQFSYLSRDFAADAAIAYRKFLLTDW